MRVYIDENLLKSSLRECGPIEIKRAINTLFVTSESALPLAIFRVEIRELIIFNPCRRSGNCLTGSEL